MLHLRKKLPRKLLPMFIPMSNSLILCWQLSDGQNRILPHCPSNIKFRMITRYNLYAPCDKSICRDKHQTRTKHIMAAGENHHDNIQCGMGKEVKAGVDSLHIVLRSLLLPLIWRNNNPQLYAISVVNLVT